MATAELRVAGPGGFVQQVEVMSADIGIDPAGLDRTVAGHYPIGTLRVGPAGTVVDLVDAHDNDGQGQTSSEAVYVQDLVVEAAATLNTNGVTVYHLAAQVDGVVDEPANLVAMSSCPWDCGDGDGGIGIVDFLALLADWGDAGACDFDGLGVGITDFLTLLANWGPCS